MIDLHSMLIAACIFFIATMIQSIVGFGLTLVALPFLLFSGFALPDAVAICVVCGIVQRVILIPRLYKKIDWKLLRPMIIIGIIFIPVGALLLHRVANLAPQTVKQIIGVIIIISLLLQWLGKVKPRESIHKFWTYLAGAGSGFLTGFANIGGPPLVLWILAHRFPQEIMRAICLLFFLFFSPFQVTSLLVVFGKSILPAFGNAMLISPAVIAGTLLGIKIGSKLSDNHLRLIMQLLLLIVALISIVKGFI